jgi:hypothetical protein
MSEILKEVGDENDSCTSFALLKYFEGTGTQFGTAGKPPQKGMGVCYIVH